MPQRKRKTEIPSGIATEILFLSDRTCCVCCERNRPIQIHHIDGDPSNSAIENLAVLCLTCHHDTQVRGGFSRKLDAPQILRYKADWLERVEKQRNSKHPPALEESSSETHVLRYLQMTESSDEHSYDFAADYLLVGYSEAAAESETNLCITAFVTRHLQRFRAIAISRSAEKDAMKKTGRGASAWDSLAISHSISIFTPRILSLEFQLASYAADAMHPNSNTHTLNFQLHPSMELNIGDIFKPSADFLELLSRYCINDLIKQQPARWYDPAIRAKQLQEKPDDWILTGAGPDPRNFENFSIRKNGLVIHFDPYQVGSYAEGKYEVFIPSYELKSTVRENVANLLLWG
jgi:hypothetical protein